MGGSVGATADASVGMGGAVVLPTRPVRALVYNGPGAGMRSALTARQALLQALAPCSEVGLIGTQALLSADWARHGQCDLLCMPGGADMPYCNDLNGRGNQIIRRWVEAGGAYLGICAGAYYACSRCEFEPGTALEVVGDRQLALFPGLARGAVVSGFDYRSEAGAAVVPLRVRVLRGGNGGGDCSSVGARSSIGGSAAGKASAMQPAAAAAAAAQAAVGAAAAAAAAAQSAGAAAAAQPADGAIASKAQSAGVAAVAQPAKGVSMAAAACGVDTSGWLPVLDYSNGGPLFCALNGNADLSCCGSGTSNTGGGSGISGGSDNTSDGIGGSSNTCDGIGGSGVSGNGSSGSGNSGGGSGGGGSGDGSSVNGNTGGGIGVSGVSGDGSSGSGNSSGGHGGGGSGNSSGGFVKDRAVDVLAVYAGPPSSAAVGAAAAVRVAVGAGAAVLCGTHPELPADWLRASEEPPAGSGLRAGAAIGSSCSRCSASGSEEGSSGAVEAGGGTAPRGVAAEGGNGGSGGVATLGVAAEGGGGVVEVALHSHVHALAQELEAADVGRRALWRLLLHAALCWDGPRL